MTEQVANGVSDAGIDTIEQFSTTHPDNNKPAPEADKVIEPTKDVPLDDSDDESEGEEASNEGKPKKPGGFKRKLEKQERELQAERQRNAELLAEVEKYRPKPEIKAPESKAEADGKPDMKDLKWTSFDEYNEALQDWKADQKVKKAFESRDAEQKTKAEDTQFKEYVAKTVDSYNAELVAYESSNPGITAKLEAAEEAGYVTPEIALAVMSSPDRMAITNYLADNPDVLASMSKMNPKQLEIQLAKIQGRIEALGTREVAGKTTKASPPISPVKSKAETSTKQPKDMSQEEFERWMRS